MPPSRRCTMVQLILCRHFESQNVPISYLLIFFSNISTSGTLACRTLALLGFSMHESFRSSKWTCRHLETKV